MDAQAPNKVPFVTHATLIMRARSEGGREGGRSENRRAVVLNDNDDTAAKRTELERRRCAVR